MTVKVPVLRWGATTEEPTYPLTSPFFYSPQNRYSVFGSHLVRRTQPISDAGFGEDELRTLGVSLDLLP